MNLVATVFREHLSELELMRALPAMQARLQSLGLPVSEDAMQTWEACRKTFTQADVLEAENVTLRAECDDLRAECDDLRAKISTATEQARALDAEADRLRAEITRIESETVRVRAETDQRRQRIAELEKKVRDPHLIAAALICKYGIRNPSKTETETPKNHHAPHQEN